VFELLFWVSAFLVIYTSMIYYAILICYKKNYYDKNDNYEPAVSLIICAYNEEKNIEKKLQNTFSLDYPSEKLQVILADDGSTDNTVEIGKTFNTLEILPLARRGKTNAQNQAMKIANNEIIVFSDANNIFKTDAIRKLVQNFADTRIGAVCGELRYSNQQSKENLYWKYEIAIKNAESRNGRLLGANGSIYAVRRSAYVSLPDDAISDHLEPIMIYGNGLDVVYEPNAVAIEESPKNVLKRKRRIILRSLVSMKYILNLLNPLNPRTIFVPYFSHKFIRWFLPILLIICFLTSFSLAFDSIFYLIVFLVQCSFLIASIFHSSLRYILKVNVASLLAIKDWMLGKKQVIWNVSR